jgi:hypothetical protein
LLSSNLSLMVLMALVIGVVFSFVMREGRRDRLRFALYVAGVLVGLVVVLAWLMLPFPG